MIDASGGAAIADIERVEMQLLLMCLDHIVRNVPDSPCQPTHSTVESGLPKNPTEEEKLEFLNSIILFADPTVRRFSIEGHRDRERVLALMSPMARSRILEADRIIRERKQRLAGTDLVVPDPLRAGG